MKIVARSRRRRMGRIPYWFIIAALVAGCSGPEEAASSEPGRPALVLLLDGAEMGSVELDVGGAPRPLASLLPPEAADPETWLHVEARSEDGRSFGMPHPSVRRPGTEARVYVHPQSGYSLGFFRVLAPDANPAQRAALRRPVIGLEGVEVIEVHTRRPEPDPEAAPRLQPVVIQVPGHGRGPVSATELARLPTRPDPRGRSEGWALLDLLRLRVGDRPIDEVVFLLDGDAEERVALEDLTDPTKLLMVKHNRRGELRYQEYDLESELPQRQQRATRTVQGIVGIRVGVRGAAD